MYVETKFGATGFITFRVHRNRGLVSGSYGFPFGSSEDQCEDLFLGFRRTLEAGYGAPGRDLRSRHGGRYCEGSRSGDTGARVTWSDPAGASVEIKVQGAMVVVEFEAGGRAVHPMGGAARVNVLPRAAVQSRRSAASSTVGDLPEGFRKACQIEASNKSIHFSIHPNRKAHLP